MSKNDPPVDPLEEEFDPLDEVYEPAPLNDEIPQGVGDHVTGRPGFQAETTKAQKRLSKLQSVPYLRAEAIHEDSAVVRKRKRAFLAALASTGIVAHAAARAGWCTGSAYHHKTKDKVFADMWEEALAVSADLIEMEALRRAVHGYEKPIWDRGGKDRDPGILGYETQYSDSLMSLLLKARKPEKFRERHEVDHRGDGGGGVLIVPGIASLEDWSLAAAKQQAQYRDKQED
jgi:hypothetical protein